MLDTYNLPSGVKDDSGDVLRHEVVHMLLPLLHELLVLLGLLGSLSEIFPCSLSRVAAPVPDILLSDLAVHHLDVLGSYAPVVLSLFTHLGESDGTQEDCKS